MTKYCPEKTAEFCKNLRATGMRTAACERSQIGYDAFCVWMKKPEFAEAVKKVEREITKKRFDKAVDSIQEHMKKNWQAAAWWLERKHKKTFAKQENVDHTSQGEKISFNVINYGKQPKGPKSN
ncbi:MAG: hypothetical protein A4E53_01712 [Pelotomaculum sp. PtaB.Bin104]|nr:MAG: hypothetical protein A4E53_01712 [Pelotomaculum sp. PtaB.Bin104]